GRQPAVPVHAASARHRAGRGHGPRAVALRSACRDRPPAGLAAPDLPRPGLSGRPRDRGARRAAGAAGRRLERARRRLRAPRADCGAKLFLPTADARLIALDPETGAVCTRFGDSGQIDLSAHMPNVMPGSCYATSPPVVTRHLVIVGGTVLDNYSTREESGV